MSASDRSASGSAQPEPGRLRPARERLRVAARVRGPARARRGLDERGEDAEAVRDVRVRARARAAASRAYAASGAPSASSSSASAVVAAPSASTRPRARRGRAGALGQLAAGRLLAAQRRDAGEHGVDLRAEVLLAGLGREPPRLAPVGLREREPAAEQVRGGEEGEREGEDGRVGGRAREVRRALVQRGRGVLVAREERGRARPEHELRVLERRALAAAAERSAAAAAGSSPSTRAVMPATKRGEEAVVVAAGDRRDRRLARERRRLHRAHAEPQRPRRVGLPPRGLGQQAVRAGRRAVVELDRAADPGDLAGIRSAPAASSSVSARSGLPGRPRRRRGLDPPRRRDLRVRA